MSDKIYYCTQEDNDCPKKEECKRFMVAENQDTATLFKMACTEDNNYVLFMNYEKNIENNESIEKGDEPQ
jgi:arginyl-tRNA--protein-N-Asp/Glu arginylyltransferase